MAEIKRYYQARMRYIRSDGIAMETTGWIEARGAKVGQFVQLLPSHEFWEVLEVFDVEMPEDVLKEHQMLHRNSLPSVEGMK